MKTSLKKLTIAAADLLSDDTGATMVEYALMLALIAAVCIGVLIPMGNEIKDVFEDLGEFLDAFLGN